MVIAIVGAGGKTTLVHKLAKEYMDKGLKVLVTTTTHMYKEKNTLADASVDEMVDCLNRNHYCMAGSSAGDNKIKALPEDVYNRLCSEADVVIVEADGSKHMPLKYPEPWEPVIPFNTDKIIIVAGLHGLGMKCKDAVHRYELAAENLDMDENTIIEPVHIEKLIRKGYLEPLKKDITDTEIYIQPMQADNLYKRVIARLLEERKDVSVVRKEWFDPCGELVICGGGHVSQFVARIAKLVDFRITVIDDREDFVTEERFPEADKRICCPYDDIAQYLPKSDNAYYVVVTRGHSGDKKSVEAVLQRKFGYLGMIGSRKKVATTMESLKCQGYSKEQIESVHAPIGLAIGARTPAEIAVSIMAEIIQVKNNGTVSTMTSELASSMEPGTLCIILDKKGSSPRGIGSMMLVTKDGILGTIGGGLVEKTAIDYAKSVTSVCEKEYTLTNEESGGIGMICGGWNRILFVPLA